MGRRKSKAKVLTKTKPKVDTVFDCPFCNHLKTVGCKINRQTRLAMVKCRVCEEKFTMSTGMLTDPIDVYGKWIDEIEAQHRAHAEEIKARSAAQSGRRQDRPTGRGGGGNVFASAFGLEGDDLDADFVPKAGEQDIDIDEDDDDEDLDLAQFNRPVGDANAENADGPAGNDADAAAATPVEPVAQGEDEEEEEKKGDEGDEAAEGA